MVASMTTARSARALLPPDDGAPVTARRLVTTMLLAWGCNEQVELIELLTSELVSNAVRHAGEFGDIELELAADGAMISLSVADGSTAPVTLRDGVHQASGQGGLGLSLVERVATRWGVEEYVLGKRVWLELARAPSP
jgi:anti-sigma regulatory factor (Ser/Thr protein kinase)